MYICMVCMCPNPHLLSALLVMPSSLQRHTSSTSAFATCTRSQRRPSRRGRATVWREQWPSPSTPNTAALPQVWHTHMHTHTHRHTHTHTHTQIEGRGERE